MSQDTPLPLSNYNPISISAFSSPPSTPASSTSSRILTRIRPNALPIPSYHPPDPTKKSHARKQPAGHVPRPRNAFILFRCDFVRQKKVPADIENDHRNISRIVGSVWREMTEEDKEPWVQMAEKEKKMHADIYPGYRYTPGVLPMLMMGRKKVKERGENSRMGGNMREARAGREFQVQNQDIRSARRSSSCPPVQASPTDLHPQNLSKPRVLPFSSYPMPPAAGKRRQDMYEPYDLPTLRQRAEVVRRAWEGRPSPASVVYGPLATTTTRTSFSEIISNTANSADDIDAPGQIYTALKASDNHDQIQSSTNILPLRRRSSSLPPISSTTETTVARSAIDADTSSANANDNDNANTVPITHLPNPELTSPPPLISLHHQKKTPTRRAFARDLNPPPVIPVLHGGPYAMGPPRDAPGWDCAPAPPMPWAEWAGERGMDVDVDAAVSFDIPNDMNFPATAGLEGYSTAALYAAHESFFSGTHGRGKSQGQVPVQTQSSTPKLQPITSQRAAHLDSQPVFTNPFAEHPIRPRSMFPGDSKVPPNVSNALSGRLTSEYRGRLGASVAAYPGIDSGVGEGEWDASDWQSGVGEYGGGEYSDEAEADTDDDEDEEELEIGSMFPRMSLDADADAEGESESESE